MPIIPPTTPKPNGKGTYVPPSKERESIKKQRDIFKKKIKEEKKKRGQK